MGAALAQLGQRGPEIFRRDLSEHFFAEITADLLHFAGDGGVFVGEICVAGPGIDDAKGVAAGRKIKGCGADRRCGGIQEINAYQTTYGRGGLIHQSAGLAKIDIFRILANLGHLGCRDLAAAEQMVQDGAHQHLKSGRGAKSGSGQHRGGAVGVKAAELVAQLGEPGGDATHQSGGGVDLLR